MNSKDGVRADPFFAKVMAFVGSLAFALFTYYLISRRIAFPQSWLGDLGDIRSKHLYSYSQVVFLYILAVTFVPALTIASYFGWLLWSRRLAGWINIGASRIMIATALPYLFWAGAIPYADQIERIFPAFLLLFFITQGIVASLLVMLSYLIPDERSRPGPLIHFGVLLCGTTPGLYILYSARFQAIHEYGVWIIAFTSAAVWFIWWAASLFISRRLGTSLDRVLLADAFSYFPLVILGLIPLFTFDAISGGKIFSTYCVPYMGMLLLVSALAGVLIIRFLFSARLLQMAPPRLETLFRKVLVYAVIPLWLYGIYLNPNIHGTVDLTHDGERLAPADAIQRGRFPIRDVVFNRGFGEDPGKTLLGFKLFGTDFAALRRVIRVIEPLRIVVLYAFGMAFFRSLPWSLGLIAVFSFFGDRTSMVFITSRTIWAYLSVVFILRYIDSERKNALKAAAVIAAWAFIWSFDVGFAAIVAGAGFFFFRLFASRFSRKGLSDVLQYIAYCAVPLLCCLLILAVYGALAISFRTQYRLLSAHGSIFYDPYPAITPWLGVLRDFPRLLRFAVELYQAPDIRLFFAYVNPLILIITACFLGIAMIRGEFHRIHEKIWLLWLIAVVYFSRSCVMGREDFTMERFSEFVWVLDYALIFYVVRYITIKKPLMQIRASGALIFAVIIYMLYLVPHPFSLVASNEYIENFSQPPHKRNLISMPDDFRRSSLKRMGNVFIHKEQAEALESLYNFFSAHLKEGDAIYDFSNRPALYFILDRPFPTRNPMSNYCMMHDDLQREAISQIDADRTEYVIYKLLKNFKGSVCPIENEATSRHFLIADYLFHNYTPYEEVGGFCILKRGAAEPIDSRWKPLLFEQTPLYFLPYVWGSNRIGKVLRSGTIIYQGGFQEHGIDRGSGRSIFSFDLSQGGAEQKRITYILVRACSESNVEAKLLWRYRDDSFADNRSVTFTLWGDDKFHSYLIRVGNLPSWVWEDRIASLRLEIEGVGDKIKVGDITLIDDRNEIGLYKGF